MVVAIIGSRGLEIVDIEKYVPPETKELVSGGANGVDSCVRKFAEQKAIPYTEFAPEYERYKKGAPMVRNKKIAEYADEVIALWDGKSRGTKSVVDHCHKIGKKVSVHIL